MPIYEIELKDGDLIQVEVSEGWESPALFDEIATQEQARRATIDIGPVRAGVRAGLETMRKGYETLMGPVERTLGQEVDPEFAKQWAAEQAALQARYPTPTVVGGAAPYMAMPYSTLPKAAASGAVTGMLEADVDPYADPGGAVVAGVKGAALGLGTTLAAERLMRPFTPSEPARGLMDEGIQPTVGQARGGVVGAMEEKLQSVPFMGDAIIRARTRSVKELNAAALKRAAPPGVKADFKDMPIKDAVGWLADTYTDAYNSIYKGKNFPLRSSDLSAIQKTIDSKQYLISDDVRDQALGYLREILEVGRDGANYSGEIISQTLSEVRRIARTAKRSQSLAEQEQGKLYEGLARQLEKWRDRNLSPAQREKAHRIDRSYANYKRVERAASYLGQDDMFTPAQLLNAVKAEGGARQFAKGRALMQDLAAPGRQALAAKIPDSGTATRLMSGAGLGAGLGYIDPSLLAAYGAGTGASWLGQMRPIQRYMLGGYRWQEPAARMLAPTAGRIATPMMLQ